MVDGSALATTRAIAANEQQFRLAVAAFAAVMALDVVVAGPAKLLPPVDDAVATPLEVMRLAYAALFAVAISRLAGAVRGPATSIPGEPTQERAQQVLSHIEAFHDTWTVSYVLFGAPEHPRLAGIAGLVRAAPGGSSPRRGRCRLPGGQVRSTHLGGLHPHRLGFSFVVTHADRVAPDQGTTRAGAGELTVPASTEAASGRGSQRRAGHLLQEYPNLKEGIVSPPTRTPKYPRHPSPITDLPASRSPGQRHTSDPPE